MALVSPGLQITVTDETQYISTALGTVPLIVLATAQDKTANGTYATGTSKANAGILQVFGSQRELVASLGYPIFQQSAAGTPLHGNELNEYGLMAAYSSLGLGNRAYVIRADVDLNQLQPTTVRPSGKVADGTYWFDLADTSWGIYEWSASAINNNGVAGTLTNVLPIIVTSSLDVTTATFNAVNGSTVEPTPRASIGQINSYAVVATTNNNRIFFKNHDNVWTLVGSQEWQLSWPVVTSGVWTATGGSLNTAPDGSAIASDTLVINGQTITGLTGITLSTLVSKINIAGVHAWATTDNRLAISCSAIAKSDGTNIDGKLSISGSSICAQLQITVGSYTSPTVLWGAGTNADPSSTWRATAVGNGTGRPGGSVWFKTGATGNGANFVFKEYGSLTDTWTTQSSSFYLNETSALAGLSTTGGSNIGLGTLWLDQDPESSSATSSTGLSGYKPMVRTVFGAVKAIGSTTFDSSNPIISGSTFILSATQPGTTSRTTVTVTVNGTNFNDFVAAILAANVPYVSATVEDSGSISISHTAGGTIYLYGETYNVLTNKAGFPATAGLITNMRVVGTTRIISGFSELSYTYSFTTPTADPEDGTLWFNSDATAVDIMINNGTAWKGYKNVSSDARLFNLTQTDPNGPIVAAITPTKQSDGTALAAGDIWLDTSDLENWPKLSRYNGSVWYAIDNTDQTSANGILFADARWDSSGTAEPVSDNEVSIATLGKSDYLDIDAPNPLLYPAGMLLFNTRRSGYNVKRYVSDYFNKDTFTVNDWVDQNYSAGSKVLYGTTIYVAKTSITLSSGTPPNNAGWASLQTGTWVTASGLKTDGSMYAGHNAQRKIVVSAMQSAISANTQVREDQFKFNLITAPGYPELIDEMVSLGNDRANTAFIIGDTPMTLSTNSVELSNWSNNTNGDGLATSSPYLAVYYPSGLSSDVQGNEIMVPPSHMALRAYLYNDNVSYPWFAPAGTRRGLVDNAADLGYLSTVTGEFVRTGVSHSLRDTLYELNINPLTIMPGTGIVVWGQKTRNPTTSAMDRVNVARLVNYIRTILASSGNAFLFEPNDKITRDQIKQVIEGAMNDLVSKRGIYDYIVVCDTSNNTPDRIARMELYVDIAISPMRDVEFIYIPIRLVNPGVIGNLGK
jgi:hypothetical protein